MANSTDSSASKKKTTNKPLPAKTTEAREQRMINLSMNLAEKKLMDGTASSQLICHFLNLATKKAEYEQEKLKADTKLQMAKVQAIESQKEIEELYANAISAMRVYQGMDGDDLDDY